MEDERITQQQLPEDAAQILRDNLWQLYGPSCRQAGGDTEQQINEMHTAEWVAERFAEYCSALRILCSSGTTVPQRREAIHIRDEFVGGLEGHIGTLLARIADLERGEAVR